MSRTRKKQPPRRSYRFPVVLEPDDNGALLVTCPDVPDMVTFGRDRLDALRHARGALKAVLDERTSRGMALPMPRRPRSGQDVVTASLSLTRNMASYSRRVR